MILPGSSPAQARMRPAPGQLGTPRRRDARRRGHAGRLPARGNQGSPAGTTAACQGRRAHTGDMGRIIGTILSAILLIWLAVTAASGIFATLKAFVIIGLIAMAVFIVVWLVARGSRRR
jgi:hypothetical protein